MIYTVSFFGHRYIDDSLKTAEKLEELILSLIAKNEYVDFLVGRNGEFDRLVSSTIHRIKRETEADNVYHVLVLPYNSAEFADNEDSFYEYYDNVEICPESFDAHFKRAIQVRNQKMVDRSDFVVFYVKNSSGGALKTLRYAESINKDFINIAEGV